MPPRAVHLPMPTQMDAEQMQHIHAVAHFLPDTGDGGSLHDVALNTMAQVLRQHRGNVSAAAKALGVSRNTIYRKKDQLPPDVWG